METQAIPKELKKEEVNEIREGTVMRCFECGRKGHMERSCRKLEMYKCGKRGHMMRECRNYTRGNGKDRKYQDIVCYHCGRQARPSSTRVQKQRNWRSEAPGFNMLQV